ncbi:hypothetical protein AGMMS49983_21180 [Clostridia bacterium]|nr:hypothetical protein AGMMS49983_21180 [Clostridia bacterium]
MHSIACARMKIAGGSAAKDVKPVSGFVLNSSARIAGNYL